MAKSISLIDNLFFMILLCYLGSQTEYGCMHSYTPIGLIPYYILMLLYVIRKPKINLNLYFKVILIYTLYNILLCIKYHSLYVQFARYLDITFAFVLISLYGEKIVSFFEKNVVRLSFVSLILYFIALSVPTFIDFFKSFSFNPAYPTCIGSWFFFGLSRIGDEGILPIRNIGFAWEPGRFSSILVVAIFFNLILHHFKHNKDLVILLIALLSTQSTTGYAASIICILFYVYNVNRKTFLLMLIFWSVLICAVFMNVSFLGEKMIHLLDIQSEMEGTEAASGYSVENGFVPQRFVALYLSFLNFINDPILGHGKDVFNSFMNQSIFRSDSQIILSNGLLQIFAEHGILIASAVYYVIYRTSMWLSEVFHYRGMLFFMLIILSINISYNFFQDPLIVSLCFLWYFRIIAKSQLLAYGKEF